MPGFQKFSKSIFQVASENGFWLRVLGKVDKYEIWLIRSRDTINHHDPKLLIVAGFHGEEKAGPLAIQKWFKSFDRELLKDVDLSFIPIINPMGYQRGTRYNAWGEKSNQGFIHQEESGEKPSREGQILLDNIDLIKPLASNGFLSLHEDKSERHFYLYTYEKDEKPGNFTKLMKKELNKFFPRKLHGVAVGTDSLASDKVPKVVNGLVYNLCDGSFEDMLFHLGTPRVAVTETPGKYRLQRRIDAGVSVINKFIDLCKEK